MEEDERRRGEAEGGESGARHGEPGRAQTDRPSLFSTHWALCTEQMPTYLKSTLIISVECVYQ